MRDRTLNRIITGRLQFSRDDLFLYIEDPTTDIVSKSYAIYDDVYSQGIKSDIYLEKDVQNLLIKMDLWTPLDDREADKKSEEVKTLKIRAYENFFKKRELFVIKKRIQQLNKEVDELRSKRHMLRRETCEGLAEEERNMWIMLNSVYNEDGTRYDFNGPITEEDIIFYSLNNGISGQEIRDISKNDPWRTMWMVSSKSGELFNKPSTQFTDYQLALCQYSIMYDNVYQSMECPPEDVILDDDCLDGWFLVQRKEMEEKKKEKGKQDLLKNPKIRNAQEVFVKVDDTKSARNVFDMNTERGKQIISERGQVIDEKGRAKQGHFKDVQQDVMMKANQTFVKTMKGKK